MSLVDYWLLKGCLCWTYVLVSRRLGILDYGWTRNTFLVSGLQHLTQVLFQQGVLEPGGTDCHSFCSAHNGNGMELPPVQVYNNERRYSALPTVEHPLSCRHCLWIQQSTEVTSPWFYQRTVSISVNASKIFRKFDKKKSASVAVLITSCSFSYRNFWSSSLWPRYFYEAGTGQGDTKIR
jgi:hypothetical protein